mmetsp:Transcript_3861/g.2861  ORF Transcript_3861/g.2861 Transcript_3861/m.2861 type:complete len:89 (-) Transcript_3861:548-814(-)
MGGYRYIITDFSEAGSERLHLVAVIFLSVLGVERERLAAHEERSCIFWNTFDILVCELVIVLRIGGHVLAIKLGGQKRLEKRLDKAWA